MQENDDVGFDYEVVIVGGGPAGLSAALVLGRARRRVLVCDVGEPRNAPSPAAHSFFTRDGAPPAELLRVGREQLRPYDTVELRDARVIAAGPNRGGVPGFGVTPDGGRRVSCRHLILATGLVDDLPAIPGLRELWGTSVLHCPYCHGWEARDEPFGLLGNGAEAVHFAKILLGWSRDLVVCTNGPADLSPEDRAWMKANGVAVRDERVAALEADAAGRLEAVTFDRGEPLPRRALFVRAPLRQRSPLPQMLGCTFLQDPPYKGLVRVDETGYAGVEGLYVVGDASRGFAQISTAVYEGAAAATSINNGLLLAGVLPAATRRR